MSDEKKKYPMLYVKEKHGPDGFQVLSAYDLNITEVYLGTDKLTDIIDATDKLTETAHEAVKVIYRLKNER